MEPPPSAPQRERDDARAHRGAAALELPPVSRRGSNGLRAWPWWAFRPLGVDAYLVHVGLADEDRPAARSRATTVASAAGWRSRPRKRVPAVVGYGTMSNSSLTATGTPSSGPSGAPRRCRSEDAAAWAAHVVAVEGQPGAQGRRVASLASDGREEGLGHRERRGRALAVGPAWVRGRG
jgi:hypothetical protein